VELISSFDYYLEDNGNVLEKHDSVQIPLEEYEVKALISSMEEYCKNRYGMSCLGFVNEARGELGLPQLPVEQALPQKPSLAAQIHAAEAKGLVASGPESPTLTVQER